MLLGCQPERLHPHLLRRPRRQLLQLRLPPPLQLRRQQLLLLQLQLRPQLQLQHLLQLLVLLPRQLPPRPRQPRLQPLRRLHPGQRPLPGPTPPRGDVPPRRRARVRDDRGSVVKRADVSYQRSLVSS